MKINYKIALVFIFIGSIIFGSGYIGNQIALNNGLSTLELITGRMFIATVVLGAILFKRLKHITKAEFLAGAFVGAMNFGHFGFQIWGLGHTTTSINAFVTSTYVVMVPFVHWLYYKKSPGIHPLIGAGLTIIGVGFISLNDGFTLSFGVILTLICALFTAVRIFGLEIFTKKFDPINLTLIMLGTCFSFALTATLISYTAFGAVPVTLNSNILLVLLYLGVVSTIVPFTLINIGHKYVPATQASLIMAGESIFATLFAFLIFSEGLTVNKLIGFVLIFGAIVIAETKLFANTNRL